MWVFRPEADKGSDLDSLVEKLRQMLESINDFKTVPRIGHVSFRKTALHFHRERFVLSNFDKKRQEVPNFRKQDLQTLTTKTSVILIVAAARVRQGEDYPSRHFPFGSTGN
jgi:DNA-binding winged helix-turn-helix (wHTH) protein